ncbi:MAG: GNAT family N-acetyltransferase [Fidelibacterota bacterium]
MVKVVESDREMEQALAIRREVFIEEQEVPPEIEMDAWDAEATHVLAILRGRPVGTARWRETGAGIKLERFAVPSGLRGRGIGKTVLKFVLDQVRGSGEIYLYAQQQVVPFYEKYGFLGVGEVFWEADIPHLKMVYVSPFREERQKD